MKVAIGSVDPADTGLDPSKKFADACWRRNPRLSPDSWRLHALASGGITVGKLWRDARAQVPDRDGLRTMLAEGLNGFLLCRATAAVLELALADLDQVDRRALLVAEVLGGEVLTLESGTDVVLWVYEAARSTAAWQAGFAVLERAVAEGRLQGYGVAVTEPVDVASLWPLAQAAAAEAWGRRRRPGWRALLLPLGVGRLDALREAVCEGKISMLEWAARREMLVLAEGAAAVQLPDGSVALDMDLAAMKGAEQQQVAALVLPVAEAEERLIRVLGGWPHVNDEQVFSVLQHLQERVPLWPGEAAFARWQREAWPALQVLWQRVAAQQVALAGDIGAYLGALEQLMAQGARVARWNGWYLGYQVREHICAQALKAGGLRWQRMLDMWGEQEGTDAAQEQRAGAVVAANVIASVPGVGGVVGPWDAAQVRLAMVTPGLADVGEVLG